MNILSLYLNQVTVLIFQEIHKFKVEKINKESSLLSKAWSLLFFENLTFHSFFLQYRFITEWRIQNIFFENYIRIINFLLKP